LSNTDDAISSVASMELEFESDDVLAEVKNVLHALVVRSLSARCPLGRGREKYQELIILR
jgi:hypothetical protein